MKNIFLLTLIAFTLSCSHTSSPKFKPLFNGKSFDGWYLKIRNGDTQLAQQVFAIEDSQVHVFNHAFPDTFELKSNNRTHGLFYSDSIYSKFHLRFEYKWGSKIANNFDQWQYDAGCYYHVTDDKIWPIGLEYQIRYDHTKNQNHTADFWASKPLTWYATKDSATFLPAADGGITIPNKKGEILGAVTQNYHALDGQWNVCEVIAMADKYVIHKLNGEVINIATNLPFSEGKIGFQAETAEIFYRNIEIMEFDQAWPIEQFLK